MTEYNPHKWVVVQIQTDDGPLYKVFGSWHGGYLDGDSWRINSGVKSVSRDGDYILFHGYSGSIYRCHKDMYGMTVFGNGVLTNMMSRSDADPIILDEDTNWLTLEI